VHTGVCNPGDKPPLTLTVAISNKPGKQGFFIAATGAVLPGSGADASAPTIPKKGNTWDFAALTAYMEKIKAQFPTETKLIISADPDVEYSVLVHTMDATRETHDHKRLFFDVSLAQM